MNEGIDLKIKKNHIIRFVLNFDKKFDARFLINS